jgi:mannosyl-oligosaccharide alpha-1,2-mannosidase
MLNDAGMLLFIKRWTVFVAITAICLLLISTLHTNILPVRLTSTKSSPSTLCPVRPPDPAYTPVSHERFNWRTVPVKHPVESLMSLPTTLPSSLPQIQHTFSVPSPQAEVKRKERQDAVKAAFQRGWTSYKEKAWMKDELAPISGSSKNTFGGWGATLVDSLDTLWIMDMRDDFDTAVGAAMNISLAPEDATQDTLNLFETTIRYLGGLLSAYDLTECKDNRLLDKAVEFGDMIYASFDTPTHMPTTRWSQRTAANGEEQLPSETGIIAELGSLSMEFTRLSQLTGDMRYFDAIQRIAIAMDEQQNKTKLPGMWPVGVNVRAPDLTTDNTFSLGAMSDSAYEYLPKTYALLGGVGPASIYQKMYEYSANTAIQHLLFRPMVPGNADILMTGIAHADNPSAPTRESTGQHLVCFVGGMLALGGRLIGNTTHVDLGRRLTDGCIWAYKNSPLGIMPEWFKMSSCPTLDSCEWDETQWRAQAQDNRPFGFTEISDSRYILRPEAIESVFILYRITGDTKFQEAAWDMFQAIENNTRTEFANAALHDVTRPNPAKDDSMESFWMAETLKYFYLIFSKPDLISLDDFIFNTEAHPFRLRK